VPYDQTVVFLEEIHPSPAKECRVSITLDPSSPPGSKLRFSGVAISADPGHIAGRVGEVRVGAGRRQGWGGVGVGRNAGGAKGHEGLPGRCGARCHARA
jgi:hypothetical protein